MNYPDDMNSYNDNPRSPTYDESVDNWIESRAADIAKQMISDRYELNGATYKIADVLEFIAGSITLTIEYEVMLSGVVSHSGADQLYRVENLAKWMQDQAEKVALPLAELEAEQWREAG